ncbi:hypothetical protein ACFR99_08555 [Haloarchaeobius amylolyticus]|uniref:DUF7322 domain-containing protein n=1 Tax=Haloarchaeobius amylolyticus TaxID=1198296 RepID=A0ABD6BGD7_9EURY
MGFDPPGDDDPLEDPFGDDPLEDPFESDPFEDPIGDRSGGDSDLERTFSKISRSTLLAFVVVAGLIHAGLFGASLGVMLIGFRSQWVGGGALVIGGGVALVVAVVVYRRYSARQ